MKHIEYAYTHGMDDAKLEDYLRSAETGVLALAEGDDAYAVPLEHYYDGEGLYFRLGITDDSTKQTFLDSSRTACYVVHGVELTENPRGFDSWSIIITGELVDLPTAGHGGFETAELNRHFSPIRVFDEAIGDIDVTLFELVINTMTGRLTPTQGRGH